MSSASKSSDATPLVASAAPVTPIAAAFRDAELRDYAEAFHARLRSAGVPWAKMVRVTTHLIDVLTDAMATERLPTSKKR